MSLFGVNILWSVALAAVVINIPFGFWRAAAKKFSLPWLAAVHLPVAMMVALRILTGLGWHVTIFATLAACFFVGQFLGGRLRRAWKQIEARRPLPGVNESGPPRS